MLYKLEVYNGGSKIRTLLFLKGEEMEMSDYIRDCKRKGYSHKVWAEIKTH